jgi:3-oxoacyl-[acyl-carrier protein] reductase
MKIALVTGGSRGIGRAISLRLAANGYHVIVNYKSNNAEAEKTLSLIRDQGNSCELLPFNVADRSDIKDALGSWIENHPEDTIDILVNNAGIKEDNLMIFMKDEQWEDVISTNLHSFFYITRLVLQGMLMRKFGRIINVVSLSGLKGLPGQTNYSAAKAGVIGATKALSQEVARKGVTVNAVAPGFIRTDMTKELNEKE